MNSYFNPMTTNHGAYHNLTVTIKAHMGGLAWNYKNKNGDTLSVVLHNGSYGGGSGLFEIMPSWRKPSRYDSVKGYLDFGQVQRWINELRRRDEKVTE